jgi:DNA-binding response OmpR family regulator
MTSTDPRRVLIVEDDRELAHVLRRNLEAEGYAVSVAFTGPDGAHAARDETIDLVILDVMLPLMDGFDVLERIRRHRPNLSVLLLTARRQLDDKVLAFKLGADDYLTKPFGIEELTARVAALLRRADRAGSRPDAVAPPNVLREGPVEVQVAGRTVLRDGRRINLTPKAFDLLVALLARRGETINRTELMSRIWGYADGVISRTLDAHVAELRRRLERRPNEPELIHTVWKVGYRCAYEPQEKEIRSS